MRDLYYIYHVTAWTKGENSPHSQYVVEKESTIQTYLDSFDKGTFDDSIQAIVETEGFENFQEAENYLLEYYS